jgi:hypothetical protein
VSVALRSREPSVTGGSGPLDTVAEELVRQLAAKEELMRPGGS